MISKSEIDKILSGYGTDVKVCTLGSHSALQIARGARDEGMRNVVVCTAKNERFYRDIPCVDEVRVVESYKDLLEKDVQDGLISDGCVLVPHGSFVEYVGAKDISERLRVPMHGNRLVLSWEADRKKQFEWLGESGARVPEEYRKPEDIDRLVIVKFPGAKGGRGYFLAADEDDYYSKLDEADVPDAAKRDVFIQEYVVGTRFYPHFFYSPLSDRLELLGMDIRYESNIDGLSRIPAGVQKEIDVDPSYVVAGNIPVVMRESLLPSLMDLGRGIVDSSKKLFAPGMLGAFCVEMVCTDALEFVCFEISARIVAGTNLYVGGSAYSQLLYDEPMSTGRRICRDIKEAAAKKQLERIIY